MKQQSVTDMIKDVRTILEENVSATPLEGVNDIGTLTINSVIEGVLTKAVTAVAKIAPMELFDNPKYLDCSKVGIIHADPVGGCRISINIEDWDIPGDNKVSKIIASCDNPDADVKKTLTQVEVLLPKDQEGEEVNIRIGVTDCPEYTTYIKVVYSRKDAMQRVYMKAVPRVKEIRALNKNGDVIDKPEDLLRTLYIQGEGWSRPVLELSPLNSPYVSIARSGVNLSVGNKEKPLVVSSFVKGKPVFELYPSASSLDLIYVEKPKITEEKILVEEGIEEDVYDTVKVISCDDGILHASEFYAAYLVAMIKGYQNAEAYKNAAIEALASNTSESNS